MEGEVFAVKPVKTLDENLVADFLTAAVIFVYFILQPKENRELVY